MLALLRRGRRLLSPPILMIGDHASRRWLARAANPYLDEIDATAALVGRSGVYALDTSYEWCCTCGVAPDPDGGVRLLRVLDWGQPGLGEALVVARQRGPAGEFANVTWPGFVGVVTAMAPGRFAVALNQPPAMSWRLTPPLDWLVARVRVQRSAALPPAHLLRQVCEQAATYAQAVQRLREVPLCLPALFSVAGVDAGEGCVIERLPDAALCRPMPTAVANHWVGFDLPGHPRGRHSRERQSQMEAVQARNDGWLAPPVVNRWTRLTAAMNPSNGRLIVQGWNGDRAITAPLTL
ncbi:MAG TPA: hypothetical protein VFA12_00185 [Stellaceae bacterium]|nr:hypothetical protein [Stellaceae bacterium]